MGLFDMFAKKETDEQTVERLAKNAGNIVEMLKDTLRGPNGVDMKFPLLYAAGLAGHACLETVKAERGTFQVATAKNGKHFYLCITRPDARFRTADISKQAGSSRLSFAPEEKLYELLRCHGGSASPLGLMFTDQVALLADRALLDVPTLAFHPCDNAFTVAMSNRDFFEVFLPDIGVEPMYVEIHDFLECS